MPPIDSALIFFEASSGGGPFDRALVVFGALLVLGSLLAGVARRTFLSLMPVFVVTGFVLGSAGLEVLEFDPTSAFVEMLAVVALILILFRDGLEVEAEMLQRQWRVPFRKLVLAMPITGALVACATKAVTDLSWTQAFLVGALLSPTDPVLTSSLVTNPRVPRLIRHSLNLESGLNDGLGLTAVLAFLAALDPAGESFVWWKFIVQDVVLGAATGIVVGCIASVLMSRKVLFGHELTAHEVSLLALGTAFTAYGIAVLDPAGNGFIAVFVSAITLGILRPPVRETFEQRSEDIIEIVKLGIFLVFGSLLTVGGLFGDGLAALAVAAFTLLIARPIAVFFALAGSPLDSTTKAFMAWFGPKGVATMAFALLVLAENVPAASQMFYIAALTVFVSILAHGLTDVPGANWIAKRPEQRGPTTES
jgi:sodium/hydrogen antiporter